MAGGSGDVHGADGDDAVSEIHLIYERGGAGSGVQIHGNVVGATEDRDHEAVGGAGEASGGDAEGNFRGSDNAPRSSPGVGGVCVIPSGKGFASGIELADRALEIHSAAGGSGEIRDGVGAAVHDSGESEVPPFVARDWIAGDGVVAIGSGAVNEGEE